MEDQQSSVIRVTAFEALRRYRDLHGDTLKLSLIEEGFKVNGETVLFLARVRGIFKPRQMREFPLSITTVRGGPYNDSFAPGQEFIYYKYQGQDPNARDNVMLQKAMRHRIPLIYFYSTVPGLYMPIWPVYVVGDSPATLTFTVAADDRLSDPAETKDSTEEIRRGYLTAQVRQRIHQRAFRDRVIRAYREHCCVCNLAHSTLLDAAHIIPDADPDGEPVVRNGLSLCKLHHTAYDRSFFGIRPDRTIQVRKAILEEEDGPILEHGLKKIHGQEIKGPQHEEDRPEAWRLEMRFDAFLQQTNGS